MVETSRYPPGLWVRLGPKALSIVEHDYFNWVTGPRRESLLVWMEIKIASNGGIVVVCGFSEEPQEVAVRSLILVKT